MHRSSAATKAFSRGLTLRSPLKPTSFFPHHDFHVCQSKITSPVNSNITNVVCNWHLSRYMSSGSSGSSKKSGGGSKSIVFGSVAVISLVGGTLGYAGIDPEFREYVEGMVPGAKEAFEAILGNAEPKEGIIKIQKSKLIEEVIPAIKEMKKIKTDAAVESTPPSKLRKIPTATSEISGNAKENLAAVEVILPPLEVPVSTSPTKVDVKPAPSAPTPPLPSTAHFPTPFEQVTPKVITSKEETTIEIVTVDENEPLQKEHSTLEKEEIMAEIESAVLAMSDLTNAAVKAGCLCKEAIENHCVLVEKVLEKAVGDDSDADDGTWKDVFEAANKKADHLEKAETQIKEAKSSIKRALEVVERAKASEDPKTATNPLVIDSDELVNETLLKIQSVVESLESATKDSKLVEEYRDLVEEGRQQFRREIAALIPDTSPDGIVVRKGPLSEDELDVFVTHAYRKVCRLQQELAKQTTLAQQRLESSITDGQLRKQVVTEEVVQAELEAQRRLLEVEHQRKIKAIREEMENEVRSQLRRQAAAHADHVKDVVDVEASELMRRHHHEMEETISSERSTHQKELSSITGRVDGIKLIVRQRRDIEIKILEAQELWLACKALSQALSTETPLNGILPSIQTEFTAIEKVANKVMSVPGGPEENSSEMNEFVTTVLNSIPREALARGVYTDRTLRDRFFRVEKLAKQTALVKEGENSLLMYLLSYIRSLIMVSPSTEKLPDVNTNMDIDSLSNYDAISLARGCVERGDIDQAVRFMTLLKGESANVSKDWIIEARLLLETRQACDALLAHAAAYGLEIFPQKQSIKETGCCHTKH